MLKPQRKKGETHEQFCERLENYIDQEVKDLNFKLIKAQESNYDQHLTNPKSHREYKQEAELMFQTIAMTEHALRTNQNEYALTFLRECLGTLGYDIAQIYEDKCVVDGTYNNED